MRVDCKLQTNKKKIFVIVFLAIVTGKTNYFLGIWIVVRINGFS
jgi:hypothetical protein